MSFINKRAFSLIEMLTIIGIIVILGSLTLTGVMKSRKYSYKMTCMNNLKSLHSISLLYFQDNNCLPTYDLINKISNKNEEFICPAIKQGSNKLLTNYETVELINYTNQFINLDSQNYNPALFSDVDIRKIVIDYKTSNISDFYTPHNGIAMVILSSGQLREITVSNFISALSHSVRSTGRPRSSRKSFNLLAMPLESYDFLPAQYFNNGTMSNIKLRSSSENSDLSVISGISENTIKS